MKATSSHLKQDFTTIAHLRFIFAVLVVFVHTHGRGVLQKSEAMNTTVYCFIEDFFSHTLGGLAVPGFFLISGYLYFHNMSQWSWKRYSEKCHHRVFTLLIPFLIWNLLKLITLTLPVLLTGGGVEEVYHIFQTFGGWRMFWDGNPDYPAPILLATWYLRDLMVFCLFTPLIYLLVHYLSFALSLLLLICALFGWWPTEYVCNALNLSFFVFGSTLSIKNMELFQMLKHIRTISYIVAIVTMAAYILFAHPAVTTSIPLLYIVSATIAIFNLVKQFKRPIERWIKPIYTNASMFIYLGHSFILLSGVTWGVNILLPYNSEGWMIFRYFLIPTLTIGILLIIYQFLHKNFPTILRILYGK